MSTEHLLTNIAEISQKNYQKLSIVVLSIDRL